MIGARPAVAGCLIALAAAAFPLRASAVLSCTLSGVSTLDFGAPSPLDATSTDVSQPFTITCNADRADLAGSSTTRSANLCVSYDNGTGGASGGGNRQLAGGAGNAVFDLYASGAYGPVHWGSRAGAPAGDVLQTSVTFTRPSGRNATSVAPQSTVVTTYARLFGGQSTVPPGTYASTLTLTVEAFWSDVKADCGAGGTPNSAPSAAQVATVAYRSECRVGTIPDLSFGAIGFLTANVDASTPVGVTCTSGTPYAVGLDAGTGVGATTASRRLTRVMPPSSTVDYGLYRDAARTQNWGNDTAAGSDTQAGVGAGLAQTYPIYGRVPPQATPEPGDYRDTVVLTVAF